MDIEVERGSGVGYRPDLHVTDTQPKTDINAEPARRNEKGTVEQHTTQRRGESMY